MNKTKGFTLVELLVSLAISGIIGTVITSVYINNLHVYNDQTAAVRVQQTLRSTLCYLVTQVRMAGYCGTSTDGFPDPSNANDADNAGIVTATEGRFQLSADFDNSGILNDNGSENIDIKLRDDNNCDGVVDGELNNNSGTSLTIQFNESGGYQTVAENITAISFAFAIIESGTTPRTYTTTSGEQATLWVIPDPNGSGMWMRLDANKDGQITAADDLNHDNLIDLVNTGIPIDVDNNGAIDGADFSMIRAVRLTLLGITEHECSHKLHPSTYVVGRHILTTQDNLIRRVVSSTVTCRNMGL